ncbi:hypothetical protein [Myroides odoratus]|uniref:hypothetical protein n=1 Tax=Myroides odoratus TaxID=256 RepID=UPI0033415B60
MKRVIVVIIISFLYLSCKKEDKKVMYDHTGNFVSSIVVKGKDTISRVRFVDELLNVDLNNHFIHFGDTLYEHNKDGGIALKIVPLELYYVYFELYTSKGEKQVSGYIKNNLKINRWRYYKDKKLDYTNYYILNETSSYLSEIVYYNADGAINEEKSNYLDWRLPDTLMIGKTIGDVKYKNSWKDNIQNYVCIGYNINEDFTNLLKVKIDTFPYPTQNHDFIGFVALKFNQLGRQRVKGFVYETRFNETEKNDVRLEISHRYFEKEFFIIPRPDTIPKDKIINYNNFKLKE